MGKMLIIKGASFTPSTGGDDDNNQGNIGKDPEKPTPGGITTITPYMFYYLSGNTWYMNRSDAAAITAVGMVFADFPDTGIRRIDTDLPSLASTLNVLFIGGGPTGSLTGVSFPDPDQSTWGGAMEMTASMDTSSYTSQILLWLGKGIGQALSADEVDAIVSSAKTAITFVYG